MKAVKGSSLKMKRPPKTVTEAIETLKEADIRYERGKEYLFGVDALDKPELKK